MRAKKARTGIRQEQIAHAALRLLAMHGWQGVSLAAIAREWQTVLAMLRIYCRDRHGGNLCEECQGLAHYVHQRLDRCRFGEDKPTCAKCPVHCYQRDRREQIKSVMRYAGPKMLWEHPWLSLCHLLDGRFRRPNLATAGSPVSSD